jgi:choline dehydrogenase-like flavoprotein
MRLKGMNPLSLPSAIVSPGTSPYRTRQALADTLASLDLDGVWKDPNLWSDRVRQACNMCGFCGEFLCWGGASKIDGHDLVPGAPKSGAHSTVLQELRDMELAGAPVRVICRARAYEVLYDAKTRRSKGVRYLDTSNCDPVSRQVMGEYVILSCGAVQTARLLWMSGPPYGLGNSSDQLGRNATFHLFGLSVSAIFKEKVLAAQGGQTSIMQGLLHGEFGHTGNVTSFAPYLIQDGAGNWLKGGTLTSTAKKNPLENAMDKAERALGRDLLKRIDEYERTMEVRLTADDLPMPDNRVDLDPTFVDEFGFPVARITRNVGQHEWRMFETVKSQMESIFDPVKSNLDSGSPRVSPHVADLVGDHQMGTCRMGDDPASSVVNRWCRLHDAENVFVVDSSFMPTGLGLNPMVSVVANALRVGTHIASEIKRGRAPGSP